MIWTIILTTMLHHYPNPNSSHSTVAVSTLTVGEYKSVEECVKYATFLSKPPMLMHLADNLTVAKTAVCVPKQVGK